MYMYIEFYIVLTLLHTLHISVRIYIYTYIYSLTMSNDQLLYVASFSKCIVDVSKIGSAHI